MREVEHPTEELLANLFEQELPPADVERLLAHLDSCGICAGRLELLEPGFARYRRCRELIDPRLPSPPRPWMNLDAALEKVERTKRIVPVRRPVRGFVPAWAGALAAAIMVGVLLLWPHRGAQLGADVLLERAFSAPARRSPRAQIQVTTPKARFVRPAVLRTGAVAEPELERIGAAFALARYDWTDPLSAGAFRRWRETLERPTDEVTHNRTQYTIRETPNSGALAEASITLNASDLVPLSARFVFAPEDWVEISKAPEGDSVPGTGRQNVARGATVDAPPERSLAERELLTMLAIDRLNTSAGEPIGVDVEPDGSIVVTPYRLGSQQVSQLKAGLEGIERVSIRPPERQEESPPAVAGDEPAIDASNAVASEAHLLEELARRFPPEAAAAFTPALRDELRAMRIRRARELESDIETLCQTLVAARPLRFAKADAPAEAGGSQALAGSAVAVNRMVTSLFAGGTNDDAAWQRLAIEVSHLRRLARQYSREISQ